MKFRLRRYDETIREYNAYKAGKYEHRTDMLIKITWAVATVIAIGLLGFIGGAILLGQL